MTNLNTAHKRKDRWRLYHIIEGDFATTATTKWKASLYRKQKFQNEDAAARISATRHLLFQSKKCQTT